MVPLYTEDNIVITARLGQVPTVGSKSHETELYAPAKPQYYRYQSPRSQRMAKIVFLSRDTAS